MVKFYYFGASRYIFVQKLEFGYFVTIEDDDKKISIKMPSKRWIQLFAFREGVDSSILTNSNFQHHIGGGYYVCTKDRWVQIRRFFYHTELKEERPSKQGIVLTHREWDRFKEIADAINADFADIANEEPCFAGSDHQNQLGWLTCFECNPFQLNV